MGVGDEYRLVNVIHPPKNAAGMDLWRGASGLGTENDARYIQQAIDALSAFRGPENPIGLAERPMGSTATPRDKKGGTVYFPPGDYLITAAIAPPVAVPRMPPESWESNPSFGGSIFVPPDVALEFAPGAVLKLDPPSTPDGNGARIEIQGGINAGLQKIFDVWTPMRAGRVSVSESTGEMPTVAPLVEDRRRLGAVLLTGMRIGEVLPEWWGAAGQQSSVLMDDTTAIQAAFDAAFRDRAMFDTQSPSQEHLLPPIQVRLSSAQYAVARPLMLEGGAHVPELTDGFKLVGTQSVGNAGAGRPVLLAVFSRGALLFARENEIPLSLLFIKSAFGFVVENVCFDLILHKDAVPSELYHCRTGVWVEAGGRDAAGQRQTGDVKGALQMGRFTSCTFRRVAGNFAFRELFYAGGGIGNGIDPRTGAIAFIDGMHDKRDFDRKRNVAASDDLLGLCFDGCMFSLPAVTAHDPFRPGQSIPTDAFVGGAGLVVDAENAVPVSVNNCNFFGHIEFMTHMVAGNLAMVASSFHNTYTGGWDIYIDRPGLSGVFAPSAVTVLSSESQSCRFLGTFHRPMEVSNPSDKLATAQINTNLIGVHHTNVQIGYFEDPRALIEGRSPQFDLPSIEWDAPGVGSSLHLVGCFLGSHVEIGPWATAVMDTGTTFPSTRGGGPESNSPNRWAFVPGGRFKGNLKALRGVAGLPSWIENAGDLARQAARQLTDPCLRMGENLMMMAARPENETYPWKTGDIWMQSPSPLPSDDLIAEYVPRMLDRALHKARVHRKVTVAPWRMSGPDWELETPVGQDIIHDEWENVFGSENYSGPWITMWDRTLQTLYVDSMMVPVPGAIYEVLWWVQPLSDHPTLSHLRSVGRSTITLESEGRFDPRPRVSVFTYPNIRRDPSLPEGGTRWTIEVPVVMEAYFAPRDSELATVMTTVIPLEELPPDGYDGLPLGFRRLRFVFMGVQNRPWRMERVDNFDELRRLYKVIVRRLM